MRPKQVIQLTARHKGLRRLLYSLGGTIVTRFEFHNGCYVGFRKNGNFYIVIPQNLDERKRNEEIANGLAILFRHQSDCELWDIYPQRCIFYPYCDEDEDIMTQLFLFLGTVIETGRIDEEKVFKICSDKQMFLELFNGAKANMKASGNDGACGPHDAFEQSLISTIQRNARWL